MKRLFDISLAAALLVVTFVPLVLITVAVKLTSQGPILYWSNRVGKDNRIFRMAKFRTMKVGTPEVATHLLYDAHVWLTPIGDLLRRTSLDELPQLWNIFRGDMSFVGPRPALFNQADLIALRTAAGVHRLVPGLTGWAQINGRDEVSIEDKVRLDRDYSEQRSFLLDLRILGVTLVQVCQCDGVDPPQDGGTETDFSRTVPVVNKRQAA